MTGIEILRYCETMASVENERNKNEIRLEYLNAVLQRAKKIPKLATLYGENKRTGPSLAEIAERLDAAPTFEQVDTEE